MQREVKKILSGYVENYKVYKQYAEKLKEKQKVTIKSNIPNPDKVGGVKKPTQNLEERATVYRIYKADQTMNAMKQLKAEILNVQEVLSKLSYEDRCLLVDRYVKEKSMKDIRDKMNVHSSTVTQKMRHAEYCFIKIYDHKNNNKVSNECSNLFL